MTKDWRKFVKCRRCGYITSYIEAFQKKGICQKCGNGGEEEQRLGFYIWHDFFHVLWGKVISTSIWWKPWTWGTQKIVWRDRESMRRTSDSQ